MEQIALKQQLRVLPDGPSVYLLLDSGGNVLYVGKAASLRQRVRSYFSAPQPTIKLQKMVSQVADIEIVVTDSEQEALLLECNLIKRHRPRYNVRLKDDKSYPYLKIDLADEWPRVYMTRRLDSDGSRYLGPFASASSLRQTLKLVKRLFPFRSCSRPITGADARAWPVLARLIQCSNVSCSSLVSVSGGIGRPVRIPPPVSALHRVHRNTGLL